MKFFEDILKHRLKDATSHEGVDTDALWADIADALPAEETKRRYWGLWILLPILFIGGGLLWFGLSENQNEIASSNNTNITLIEEDNVTIEQTKTKEEQAINTDINTTKSIEKKANEIASDKEMQVRPSEKNSLSNTTKNKKEEQLKSKIIKQSQKVISSTSIARKTVSETNTPIEQSFDKFNSQNKTPANSLITNELASPILAKVQAQKNKNILPPFNPTKLLVSKILFIPEQERDLTDLVLAINPLKKPLQKKKKLHFEIGAYSGVSTVKNLFENTTKGELLQNAYKLRLGYTVGTEIRLRLKNKLSFSTGLEYSKTITQFNVVQEKDGFMDNPNTPIVNENELRTKIVRTVKHHNRLDFLTVPILVSTSKEFGKFELGIAAGLGLNIVAQQGGKSLNAQSEIADYFLNTSSTIPYTGFLSYHLRPSIQFKASEKLYFHLRPELRYASHGSPDFFGSKHSSLMSGIRFGLNFKL